MCRCNLKNYIYVILVSLLLEIKAEEEPVTAGPVYVSPKPSDFVNFAASFDEDDSIKSWVLSETKKDGVDSDIEKYNGRWEVTEPVQKLLDGDKGLLLKDKARHNAIAAKLETPFDFDGKPFVVQYEVNFQNGIECGGAYVKLLTETPDLSLKNFNDKTPYTIMFGPDKCGESYKLHFIFRHKNPKTGEFEEKHAKQTTSDLKGPYLDKSSHLYTLVVNPDNTFQMYIDQKEVNTGSLLKDMSPPINPPKEIEDKDDKKPEDWDEREKIADPEAVKPEDWDEDAPAQIQDPDAEMPEDWLEDEPTYVDDPDAEKPNDWDDDMDGEWEAPKIENPKCKEASGCGTWEAPMIPNPQYKGKWRPAMIVNPNYKGIWKPRIIPNPNFFEDLKPYEMTSIGALGLELWSMSDSIMFDNFIITNDKAVADDYARQTWEFKKVVRANKEPGIFQGLIDATAERPWLWAIYVLVVGLPLVLIFTFCCGGKKKSDPKKTDEPTPDDPHDSAEEEDKKEEGSQEEEDPTGETAEDKVDDADEGVEEGAGDAEAKTATKSDLEKDDEESEHDEEEQENATRRSPRKKKVRKQD
uniref:Calcium-binding protein Calnexin n=1 Tax=Halocynthia roretzi TaxID=7729 RepID=Q9BLH3_HALRO|nr:calcium-binding protein Calnexin [Halocynthia roretzi]